MSTIVLYCTSENAIKGITVALSLNTDEIARFCVLLDGRCTRRKENAVGLTLRHFVKKIVVNYESKLTLSVQPQLYFTHT